MTVAVATRGRRRTTSRPSPRIVNAGQPRRSRHRSTEMRWADGTYPGGPRAAWPSSRANRSGRRRSAGSTCTRPSSTRYWGTIDVLPGARRRGIGSALLVAISDVARDAGKVVAPRARERGTARGHRVPRAPRLHRVRTGHVPSPRPVRADAADGPAIRRGRDHDAGGAARPRARRPRGRPRDLRRHPRRRNRWRRATWPSSALATSTARRSRHGGFAIAVDDADRPGRGLRQPDPASPGRRGGSPGTT